MPVYKQKLKSGTTYYIHGSVFGHQYLVRGFASEVEANSYDQYIRESMAEATSKRKNSMHFNSLVKKYIDEDLIQWKDTTVYGCKLTINKYILGVFKNVRLSELVYDDFFQFWKRIKDLSLLRNSKNRIVSSLRNICVYAGKLDYDILKYCDCLPRLPDQIDVPRATVVYTFDNFFEMVKHVPSFDVYVVLHIMFFMGMRISEIRALTWDDAVDLDKGKLTIFRRASSKVGKGKTLFSSPKSAKSRRTLIIPAFIILMLKKMRSTTTLSKTGDLVFKSRGIKKRFQDQPLGSSTVKREKDLACQLAGLPQIDNHELRHSFATFLNNRMNVSSEDISTLLGHSTKAITEKYYIHSYDTAKEIVGGKIDEYMAKYFSEDRDGRK